MVDGIPFTPAPRYEGQNPLQNISNLQSLAQREQAMQQQAITFGAKQALGQIMQQHINPETGEFDHVKAFGDMASHPEISVIMPEITEQFLRIPGVQAESLQKVVNYNRDRMALDSELHAEAFRKMMEPGSDPKSVVMDLISKRVNAGTISREDALNNAQALSNLAKNPQNLQKALFRGAQFGKAAQDSLESAHAGLGYLTEEVESFDPATGLKTKAPRYMAGGLPPAAQQVMGGQTNVAPGGLAPPAGVARQAGSPSVPPAARLAEPSFQSKEYRAYMEDTDATKHWLRKEETSAQDEANKAQQIETRLHKQEELLRQFQQGPGMELRTKIAEQLTAVGAPKGVVESFLGAKGNAKDPLGAAQLARKYFFEGAANELQTAVPGMQRATNFDIQTALKASPEVTTTKEGINQYYKNMQNIINMAKERADFAGKYAQWSSNSPSHERAFKQSAYNKSLRDWLDHKGLTKTGPLDVTKKPGEM